MFRWLTTHRPHQHLKSRTHLGTPITCPFCTTRHTTAAGLTHHLERGGCPKAPNLDRESLYRLVRSRDPNGVLTKKLLGWDDSSSGSSPTTMSYEATARAWNGRHYECYFCHRGFGSLRGLNQHLASPARKCFSLFCCDCVVCVFVCVLLMLPPPEYPGLVIC